MRLILASASPRRAELLRAAGIEFDVMPANADETAQPGETPEVYVRRVSEAKATAVLGPARGRPVLAADTVVVVDGVMLGKPVDRDDARRMLRMLSGRAHEVLTAVSLIRGPEGSAPLNTGSAPLKPERSAPLNTESAPLNTGSAPLKTGSAPLKSEGSAPLKTGSAPLKTESAQLETESAPHVDTQIDLTTVEFAVLTDHDIEWYVATGEPDDKAGAYAIQGYASRFITRISGSYSNVVGLPVRTVFQMFKEAGFQP